MSIFTERITCNRLTPNGGVTTSTPVGNYTVNATTPPASFTATASYTGNNVTVRWPTQAGISYSVQWSADLLIWNNVPVGQTATLMDPTASVGRRFYRVSGK